MPWRVLFSLLIELKSASLQLSLFHPGEIFVSVLFHGSLQTLLGLPSVLTQAGMNRCKYLSSWTFGTWREERPPSPPLAGSKTLLSSPSVTYRKVTAKIWISPNLIKALSESTEVGVGRELGVQRRGGQLSSPQHMAIVSLKAQVSIYFMQQHCPKKHIGQISNTWTLNPIFQISSSPSAFPSPTPPPSVLFFPPYFFEDSLFSLKAGAEWMECFDLLQPPEFYFPKSINFRRFWQLRGRSKSWGGQRLGWWEVKV